MASLAEQEEADARLARRLQLQESLGVGLLGGDARGQGEAGGGPATGVGMGMDMGMGMDSLNDASALMLPAGSGTGGDGDLEAGGGGGESGAGATSSSTTTTTTTAAGGNTANTAQPQQQQQLEIDYRSARTTATVTTVVVVPQLIAGIVVLAMFWNSSSSRVCGEREENRWKTWAVGAIARMSVHWALICYWYLDFDWLQRNARVKLHVTHVRGALEGFAVIWFVVGNMWLAGASDDHSCHHPEHSHIYLLCVSMLIINYLQICLPCVIAVLALPVMCLCLPCIIRFLARARDPFHGKGATQQVIDGLEEYTYEPRPPGTNKASSGGDEQKSRGGGGGGSSSSGDAEEEKGAGDVETENEEQEEGEDTEDQCAVCISEFEAGEKIRKLPCSHVYHKDCVDEWLRANATCPKCRQTIFTPEQQAQRERAQQEQQRVEEQRRAERVRRQQRVQLQQHQHQQHPHNYHAHQNSVVSLFHGAGPTFSAGLPMRSAPSSDAAPAQSIATPGSANHAASAQEASRLPADASPTSTGSTGSAPAARPPGGSMEMLGISRVLGSSASASVSSAHYARLPSNETADRS